jgi:TPR repeat protein
MPTRPPIDSDALAELLQHDPQAAFQRVRDAAQAGQVDAQLLLAQMHMEGKGTAQDASAALLWYETAANNGAPMAMNCLAAAMSWARAPPPTRRWPRSGTGARPTPAWTGACTTWPTCWPLAAALHRTARRHWRCTPAPRTWAMPSR